MPFYGKKPSKPEIYLLLQLGLKPVDIVQLGFARATVYRYSKGFAEAQLRLRQIFKAQIGRAQQNIRHFVKT